MGNPKKKLTNKQKQDSNSPLTGIRLLWVQKRPVLLYVLGFMVLIILFYICWLSDLYKDQMQPNILYGYARLSSLILNLFGMETHASGSLLCSSAFSLRVAPGCDGIEAMALFASSVLVFPARWNFKLVGFFSGIAVLFTLNIVRIISLFLTGIHFPKAFEFMHVEVWQALFIIFAIGLLIFWIKWSGKGESHVA